MGLESRSLGLAYHEGKRTARVGTGAQTPLALLPAPRSSGRPAAWSFDDGSVVISA